MRLLVTQQPNAEKIFVSPLYFSHTLAADLYSFKWKSFDIGEKGQDWLSQAAEQKLKPSPCRYWSATASQHLWEIMTSYFHILLATAEDPARWNSIQAFNSRVTGWRSGVMVQQSLGGGVISMYSLIFGHLLWKDFAELGDKKALEFLVWNK